ncbi:hypothetical protein [Paenibacillus lutrae]|uniref:Uncharacterized protein n=1 Tax=Paenibacillus lutrae TaxID=2078573 RepID=A0A7X3FIJ5_9BACL|nr:hypothetical protein [Paenibacillus lutrae]MVP00350.1 hypothetical protein [Paenibacillus lutrae]
MYSRDTIKGNLTTPERVMLWEMMQTMDRILDNLVALNKHNEEQNRVHSREHKSEDTKRPEVLKRKRRGAV